MFLLFLEKPFAQRFSITYKPPTTLFFMPSSKPTFDTKTHILKLPKNYRKLKKLLFLCFKIKNELSKLQQLSQIIQTLADDCNPITGNQQHGINFLFYPLDSSPSYLLFIPHSCLNQNAFKCSNYTPDGYASDPGTTSCHHSLISQLTTNEEFTHRKNMLASFQPTTSLPPSTFNIPKKPKVIIVDNCWQWFW